MAKVKFTSGHIYDCEGAVTVYEAARALEIISREVLACVVDGVPTELSHVVEGESEVQLLTFRDEEGARKGNQP